VLADLHPHVLALPFTVLAVGLALGIGGLHYLRNCQKAAPVVVAGGGETPEQTRT